MKLINTVAIAGIIFLGLVLRLHNYETYPQRGASSDEYTYTFLGISLITQHVPVSWSFFPYYKNKRNLTIRKLYFPIVWPYFDHPPLNGLLVGGWSLLNGQDTFEKVDLKTIRLVPIALSVITSLLIFAIAKKLYDERTAFWALLIYTTATIVVMNTRAVFAENLLTPLFLTALFLFIQFRKNMSVYRALLLGILAGLSLWTKELGMVVAISLLWLGMSEKMEKKYLLIIALTSLLFGLSYIAYGTYYDAEVFWNIINAQSSRNVGPETLFYILTNPIIVNKIYYDGWYFLGFISLFVLLTHTQKHKYIIIPALFYFLFLIFSLTKEGEMGWYVIPLFPFMAIASARVYRESVDHEAGFVFPFLLFVGLSLIRYLFAPSFGLVASQFRMFMFIMFAPSLLLLLFHKNRLHSRLAATWFYLAIILTFIQTYSYQHPA